jgi:glycosyltransferase involved in cell wall biosynthesis
MACKNKILINATCDNEKPAGLSVFTKQIVSNLINIDPDLFSVLCTYDFLPSYKDKKILPRTLSSDYGTKGNFLRWTWNQSLLAYECFRRNTLLFSTVSEAPIIIKNKCVVVHDILPIRFPEVYPRLKYYFYFVLPKILKSSRYLIFDSNSAKEETFKYFNLKNIPCSVIYPGYDRKVFKPIEAGYIKSKLGVDKYYLYIGEMRPYKNLKNALIAFSKAGLDNTYFLVGGKKDNKFFPEIKRLTEQVKIEEKVKFLDYVPNEILPHLYRNAIALVFPSRYEGFGLPLLEAMATGTPAITTCLTSIPEVCKDAALYVSPDDIDEIAGSYKLLLNDSNVRKELSIKSIERSKEFSWEKSAKQYYEVLKELIR